MDIRCYRCGEPWGIDSLHDIAAELGTTFKVVQRDFQAKGCEALGGRRCAATYGNGAAVQALGELMGDDIDGLACMIEDFNL